MDLAQADMGCVADPCSCVGVVCCAGREDREWSSGVESAHSCAVGWGSATLMFLPRCHLSWVKMPEAPVGGRRWFVGCTSFVVARRGYSVLLALRASTSVVSTPRVMSPPGSCLASGVDIESSWVILWHRLLAAYCYFPIPL